MRRTFQDDDDILDYAVGLNYDDEELADADDDPSGADDDDSKAIDDDLGREERMQVPIGTCLWILDMENTRGPREKNLRMQQDIRQSYIVGYSTIVYA